MPLFFAICATHVICAYVLVRLVFRPPNRTEAVLMSGLVSFFTFYLVPIALGMITGFMNRWVISSALATSVALSGVCLFKRRDEKWGSKFPTWDSPLVQRRSWLEFPLLMIGTILLLEIFVSGLQLPIRTYDAPSYHASNPVRWHLTGRFILDSFGGVELSEQAVSAETAPNVKAILPFLIMLLTDNVKGTALTQFPFLLLLLVTVRAISIRLGAMPVLATFAAIAAVTIPEIFFQSMEAYSDLMFLSGQMTLVWAILYLWQNQYTWRSITWPALGFGLLSGAKASFLVVGGAFGLFYGLVLLIILFRSSKLTAVKTTTLAIFLTIFAIGISGGPWIFNAWQKFDNPAYPFEIAIGEKVIFSGKFKPDMNAVVIQQYTGTEPGFPQYWNTLREFYRLPALASGAGGFGAWLFIFGIPTAILFALTFWISSKERSASLWFIISFLIFIITSATLAYTRFSIFQPVMALIAFAVLVSNFHLIFQFVAVFASLVTLSYDVYMTTSAIQFRQRPIGLVAFNILSGFTPAAQRDAYPDQYVSLDYWREEISKPGLKLAIAPYGMPVWYTYAPESPADVLRFRKLTGISDVESWHREMLDAGITHLYLRRTDSGYLEALSSGKKFALLQRRLDSHYNRKNDFWIEPYPEDALFEVIGAQAGGTI